MMKRYRHTTYLAALVLAATAVGCGGHASTQEANARCRDEQRTKNTVTDEAFAQCVACFEDCGDDCQAMGETPERYACPE